MLSGEKVDADPAFSCDTPLYTECLSLTNATHSFIHATEGAVYGRADEARLVSGKDTARVLVMDLGRVCVGRVELSFSGALGDEVVDVVYCEVVDESGKPKVYLGETSIASRVILRPGDQTVTIMQKMGFRYAALCLYGKGDLRAAVTVFEEIYPLDVTGGLMCSDPQINDILAMCERTQRICSLDGYVDTPWREQGQWWGDARIQFKNTLAIARELKLFSFGTAQTGYVQIGNGLTYGLSPSRAHTCILPDFTLQWLLGIVELCRARGDMKPFERHYKGIKRALAYFGESAPKIGALLAHDKRYWLFLDWANIDRSGAPAVYNLWWLLTLRNVSILARASGHEKFAVRLEENASALHAEIMRALFDEEQGLLCDGLDAEGNRLPTCGVHAQTLAILCGVAGEHHADMLEKRLLPFLRGERQPDQPSTYWTAYVHEAALHYGYRREVIDHILREWTPMLADGSCHELAGVRDGRNSISHAWSAHPLHILPLALFGVDPLAGADSLAHIAPWFDERLSFARLARPWKNGTLVCAWRRNGSEIALEIECPEGLTLIVELQEGARVVTHNSRITLSGGHE